jgi:hypothetical protein
MSWGFTSLKVICAFLLMGSLQGIAAGVIGDPPVLRETTDTFSGYLFAYDGNFALDGLVTSWSFYAGSASNADVAGHQLTPVIMDQSDPDGWVITGIGATRTVLAAGFYAFSFDLVSGSDMAGPTRTFGWYDGSATSQNQGTISFDRADTSVGVRDFWYDGFPVLNKAYVTKNDFTGANDPFGWAGGRIYSVQFDPPDPVANPEPSTLGMLTGGFAILVWLRRRTSAVR